MGVYRCDVSIAAMQRVTPTLDFLCALGDLSGYFFIGFLPRAGRIDSLVNGASRTSSPYGQETPLNFKYRANQEVRLSEFSHFRHLISRRFPRMSFVLP